MSWTRFFRRRQLDKECEQELEAHLAIETDENIARGMSPEEARCAAHRKLGNTTLIREEIYNIYSLTWLDAFWQDLRFGLRQFCKSPGLTGVMVLSLAIGIGANTGVFSIVNALLLRSLPYRDPARLAVLDIWFTPHNSAQQFHEWRNTSTYLADAALAEQYDVNLGGAGEWRRAHVAQTSWNFFSMLGTQPILGRAFTRGEDEPGRDSIAVIGYGMWQELFGGAPGALGATIRVDGKPLTVVGVAPPGFDFPGKAVLWKPANFAPLNNGWETIARLKPGITWAEARSAFAVDANRLAARFWPERTAADVARYPFRMIALQDELAGPTRRASLVLMACVALILLIACANVANVLMARTADRATELSVRSALGASRARISQQLLTECVLLSLAGGGAGIFIAFWTASLAAKLQPAPLAAQAYSVLDGRVLGFAIAVAVSSGLLFGVLPSLHAGRFPMLGTRGTSRSRGSQRIRGTLVAAQVMLTIMLLAASISLVRAFAHLMHVDRGFDCSGLVTVNVALDGTTYQTPASRLNYFQEALARVRRLPGVRSASATEFLPLYANAFIGGRFAVDGQPDKARATVIPVFSDYFRTMGGRVVAGREFTAAEVQANAKLAIVNERFAAYFGSAASALGHRIFHDPRTIIGVVKGVDYMTENSPDANSGEVFIPSTAPGGFFSTFVARVDGRAGNQLAMIRDAIQSVDPQVPLFGVKTMEQRLDDALARPQFYRTAVLCFAVFALLLAAMGVYGTVSYTVAQRTHEMGVRMALGSTPARLRLGFLGQGLIPVAAGAIPGLAGVILGSRLLDGLVEGAQSADTATYAISITVVALIAAAGIWVATRRVIRLEIMEILRAE
jgi:putative ABC transport system permease protein